MQGSSLYRSSTGHVCFGNFRRDAFHYLRAENIWLSYILNRLFITSRVYLEPTSCPAPSWHVYTVGRALHYCLSSAHYCEDHFYSLNLFTRWLRSVVLKSLKAVKQKFLLKKNCGEILRSREWSDLAWSQKIQFSLSSCNAFQTRTSNKYAAQLSMVPDGLNARKSQIFTELQQRNFLRMPDVGEYF